MITERDILESFSEPATLLSAGYKLSVPAAKKLERSLLLQPGDYCSRYMLVGFYQGRKDRRDGQIPHLIWLIDNRERDLGLSRTFPFQYADENFRLVKRHWLRALRRYPNNMAVFYNFAHFCLHAEPKTAAKFFRRLEFMDPETEEWPRELSHFYFVEAWSGENRVAARNAYKAARRALDLHRKYPRPSYLEQYMLMTTGNLSEQAFAFGLTDAVRYYGQYLVDRQTVDLMKKTDVNLPPFKNEYEEYQGYSLLGVAAAAEGNVGLAKSYLSKMLSFSGRFLKADLRLAKALLQLGENDIVLKFLDASVRAIEDACKRNGKNYHLDDLKERVADWITQIKLGKTPRIASGLDWTVFEE